MKKQIQVFYSSLNCRGMRYVGSMHEAYALIDELKVDSYSIYRNAPGFHSTSQMEYLLDYKNDSYIEATLSKQK